MTNQNPPVPTPTNQELPSPLVFSAKRIKDMLQLLIALGIVGILGVKILNIVHWNLFGILSSSLFTYIEPLLKLYTLEIVAKALAYSAGIDLAYMLLTPGPDEAIEPLILGLASAILFSISSIGSPDIWLALEIGLYVLILAGLFVLKANFIKDDPSQNNFGLFNLFLINVKGSIKEMKKSKTAIKEIKRMIKP